MWRVAAALLSLLLAAATSLAQTVEYYELDHHGSVRVVTNDAGTVIRTHDFLPFGQEYPTAISWLDKQLFTGQERDDESGLDYFGARYYRADLGRFTTVDPKVNIKDALVEPQRWNRYAYVTNNPLRYVDPDGRDRMGMYQPGQRGEAAPWRGLWQEVKSIGAVAAGFAAPLFAPELATAAVGCFLSPACQQNALEMIAPEGSPSINPGAASSGVGAVIGHFDAGYAKVGRELRTAVFDIPKEIWDRLTPEQRTRANQVFLDAVIERGAVIKVVTNGPVRIPSTLAWEIDYLLTRGYRWNEAGDKLLPPVK